MTLSACEFNVRRGLVAVFAVKQAADFYATHVAHRFDAMLRRVEFVVEAIEL